MPTRWLRAALVRLAGLFIRRRADRDFVGEIETHLACHVEAGVQAGLTPAEARRAALVTLGGLAQTAERYRESRGFPTLDSLFQDLRYAMRALRKTPAFTLTALGTLALGIGATSAIFSVVSAVLLKPPPYPDPDRLAILGYTFQGARVLPLTSETKFLVWQRHTDVLDDITAIRFRPVNMTAGGDAEQVSAGQVSSGFFRLFGARVAQGRGFSADEDRPGENQVVVVSAGFWQRRFGSDPQLVGRSVVIDGHTAAVVGIMDASFDTSIFRVTPDVWVPLQLDPDSTDRYPFLIAAGRLKAGVNLDSANAGARVAGQEFHRQFPDASGPNDTFFVAPFHETLVRDVRWSLLVLTGAVTLVLLLACANVANLFLVRASVRQREMAIRTALGASRGRIARQLLTEGLVLSVSGGGLGLVTGLVGIRALLTLVPDDLPRLGPHAVGVTADWHVVALTLLVSLATGLLFGVLPTLRRSSSDLRATLADARGGSALGVRPAIVQSALVIAEMAIALVLVVAAGLFLRTFVALQTVHRGFDPHQVLTMRSSLVEGRVTPTADLTQLVRDGVPRLTAVAGVQSAAATCCLPLESDWRTSFSAVGRAADTPSRVVTVSYRVISPSYFEVLKIPLTKGRVFTDHDDRTGLPVTIINQAMARQFWPGGDPLAEQLVAFPGPVPGDEPTRQIVGIVGDVRDGLPLEPDARPTIYVPMAQLLDREQAGWPLVWMIRTGTDAQALATTIAHEVSRVSGLPVARVRTLDEVASQSTTSTHFSVIVLTLFGGAALVLAAIGLYGVMAYTVQQRTREIGIRVALGATARQVRQLVLVQALTLTGFGMVIGMTGAFGLSHFVSTSLFGVTAHDQVVFTTVPLVLTAVAFVAVWQPAMRATRVEPMHALRSE